MYNSGKVFIIFMREIMVKFSFVFDIFSNTSIYYLVGLMVISFFLALTIFMTSKANDVTSSKGSVYSESSGKTDFVCPPHSWNLHELMGSARNKLPSLCHTCGVTSSNAPIFKCSRCGTNRCLEHAHR